MKFAVFAWALAASLLTTACTEGTAGTAPPHVAATEKGPALWVVKDSDTTIYVFGTVHLLPDGIDWLKPRIRSAFDAADTLVLETADILDPAVAQPAFVRLGLSQGLPPLADRVPESDRDELDTAVREAGIPVGALDRMETWLATVTLSSGRIVSLGYGSDSGVEMRLASLASAGAKRIEGLETIDEQLSYLDTLPEAEQRKLLAASLDDLDKIRNIVAAAVQFWLAGDTDAVGRLLEEDTNTSPLVAKRLLADRNSNWASWIEQRLQAKPGVVFMAVGSGHLAGKDSLLVKLRERELHSVRLN